MPAAPGQIPYYTTRADPDVAVVAISIMDALKATLANLQPKELEDIYKWMYEALGCRIYRQ